MYYEDVFRALNDSEVDYLVVGGVALVLHGVVRLTVDLDLMVEMSESNLRKFVSALGGLGYKPKVPVSLSDFVDRDTRRRWVKEKNMKVFSLYHPKKPYSVVDVLVYEPIDYRKAREDRVVVDVKGVSIPVASAEHLKELKRISGRKQDLADIKALNDLEEIKNERYKKK
jgi:hypothetical protein